MQVSPYLNFNGQCEAAFKFYAECLGGTINTMIPFGGTPAGAQVEPEWTKKIMHAHLTAGSTVVMGSDVPHGRYEKPQGFAVSVIIKTPEAAERVFQALSQQGAVTMPIQKTFWSARFGMLVDQFGIPWMVNCEQAA